MSSLFNNSNKVYQLLRNTSIKNANILHNNKTSVNHLQKNISSGNRLDYISKRTMTTDTGASADKTVVVFGGNGYVGQNVCKAALAQSAKVISINRSGKPTTSDEEWHKQIKWIKADVFTGSEYKDELRNVTGVISCIGAFGSNEFMEKINGIYIYIYVCVCV